MLKEFKACLIIILFEFPFLLIFRKDDTGSIDQNFSVFLKTLLQYFNEKLFLLPVEKILM